MRYLIPLLALAAPAQAWDFSATPICTVEQTSQPVQVTMTFDPGTRLYAIALTLDVSWPQGPVFSLQFVGDRGLTISTDQHVISDDGRTLTVTDSGFGNVLDGLQYNEVAAAMIGGDAFLILLTDASDPVERFRTCDAVLSG